MTQGISLVDIECASQQCNATKFRHRANRFLLPTEKLCIRWKSDSRCTSYVQTKRKRKEAEHISPINTEFSEQGPSLILEVFIAIPLLLSFYFWLVLRW